MKNSTNTVLKSIIILLQVLILIPPLLLQFLSDRKMGVMRYLVFKKQYFSKELLTSFPTFTYMSILVFGIIFCIIYLICSYVKNSNNLLVKPIKALFLWNFLCLSFVFSYKTQTLLAYHFFIISFFIIIFLQYVKIFLKALYIKQAKKILF